MILPLITKCLLILALYMGIGYIIAQSKNDVSIVDIMWGLGFIIISWFCLLQSNIFSYRQLITTTLITLWGMRLSSYIYWRKKGEDRRYKQMKEEWGKKAAINIFLYVFMLQGLLILLIALPIILINANPNNQLYLSDYLGICLWIFGISYEVIADWQLYNFNKNTTNKNKVLKTGLWHYSRHPNYFGEILLWIGIFILALGVSQGLLGIISPLTLGYIFIFFSIPISEKSMLSNPEFKTYQQSTNSLIPSLKRG